MVCQIAGEKKKQSEGTEQALEPDLDMSGMLGLSDWRFQITMINMLRDLMEKLYNVQEQ